PALQNAVDERREPVRLVDDDLRVLAQLGRRQLPLEELRRAAQAAERILHLVRELTDDPPGQPLLREQIELAPDAPIPFGIEQLEQQLGRGVERHRAAVDDQLAVAGPRFELAQAEREPAFERTPAQGLELVRRMN